MTNRDLIDHLRATGTGEEKLLTVQSVIGQGPDAVPADVIHRCEVARVPGPTIAKIDRLLNPRSEPVAAVTPDGYASPSPVKLPESSPVVSGVSAGQFSDLGARVTALEAKLVALQTALTTLKAIERELDSGETSEPPERKKSKQLV